MRHRPFAIDTQARDEWLHCMNKALDDMQLDIRLNEHLKRSFFATADHMRNKADHEPNDQLTIVGAERKD